MTTRIRFCVLLLLSVLASAGCHHRIAFQDIDYKIGAEQYDAALVVVIDAATLNNTISIRSIMTGAAHSWDAQPGMMLKQVADVEFPQMFKHYEVAGSYKEPSESKSGLTLRLTVPQYNFADFRATVTVRAIAYGAGKNVLFEKTYTEQGFTQGAKMFWAGAFGMNSAVRQSSFDAYKKVFAALRSDIAAVLQPHRPA